MTLGRIRPHSADRIARWIARTSSICCALKTDARRSIGATSRHSSRTDAEWQQFCQRVYYRAGRRGL